MNGSANVHMANNYGHYQGPTPTPNNANNPAWSNGPPLMSDEKIFEWEFNET